MKPKEIADKALEWTEAAACVLLLLFIVFAPAVLATAFVLDIWRGTGVDMNAIGVAACLFCVIIGACLGALAIILVIAGSDRR